MARRGKKRGTKKTRRKDTRQRSLSRHSRYYYHLLPKKKKVKKKDPYKKVSWGLVDRETVERVSRHAIGVRRLRKRTRVRTGRAIVEPGIIRKTQARYTRAVGKWESFRDHLVCRSRRKRREIMFATFRAGRGKGGPEKRRLTDDSKVRCS